MKNKKLDSFNLYLLLIILVSGVFLFTRLGDRNVGCDETWTVIAAENTLENGYPKITRTYGFFPEEFVLSHESWLSFYLIVPFYLLFGVNDFASRLPFAIFGLFTVILMYFFAKYVTKDRKIAFLATLLLSTSYVFYNHVRQSRYFSLTMFFSLLLCYAYFRFISEKKIGFKDYSLFIAGNVFLFYSHIQLWFYVAASLMVHYFIFIRKKDLFIRLFIGATASLVIFAPWLYYFLFVNNWMSKSEMSLSLFSFFLKILLSFYYYFISVFSLFFILLLVFNKEIRSKVLLDKKYSFIFTFVLSVFVLISLLGFNPLPEARIIVSATLPVSILIVANITYLLFKKSKVLGVFLVVLLVFSNLLFVLPFYPLKVLNLEEKFNYDVSHYSGFIDRSLKVNSGLGNIINEVSHDYQSIHDSVFSKLSENGFFDKEIIIVTDLDINQLNYQAQKRGSTVKFVYLDEYLEENGMELVSGEGLIYIINYEYNREKISSVLDIQIEDQEGKLIIDEIQDYEDTAWIDCPDVAYKRYSRNDEKTMLFIYPNKN